MHSELSLNKSSYSSSAIQREYDRLGYELGWRFLTCPAANLKQATVALLTLNPGGAIYEPPLWSVEQGSAYLIESWKSAPPGQENLQCQVRRMFEIIDMDPASALSGYFIPFRSSKWSLLPKKKEARLLGIKIWQEILQGASINTIIVCGKVLGPDLVSILSASCVRQMPAGWGDQTIDIYKYRDESRIIFLPHLSRFGLFGRARSEAAFKAAISIPLVV